MEKLIQELSKDKRVVKLLEEFKNDFKESYTLADDIKEFVLFNYRDTVFRKWLFSPILEETYLTPNYIINTIAQEIHSGNYNIIPHMNITLDKYDIKFDVKWIINSEEMSPVIEDLEILMNYCNPTLIKREDNSFLLDDGEKVINEINFRSAYYINYLLNLGVKLGIFKEITSIGCQVYQLGDNCNEYSKLSNEQKVNEIVKNSIEVAKQEIESEYDIEDANFILELLNNDITDEDFYRYLLSDEDGKLDLLDEKENMNFFDMDMVKKIKELKLGVNIDINFTCIFGYYLGIITPVYRDVFFIEVFLNIMKLSIQDDFRIELLFSLESVHEVTKFGEIVLCDYKEEFFNKSFLEGNTELLERYIDHYIDMKKEYLYELLNGIDGILGEFCDNYLEETFEDNLSLEVKNHLDEFYNFLFIDKKLKESTCEKHCGNIYYLVVNYMNMNTINDIKKISKDLIHKFLIDWYIPMVATSKTNVKSEITSISQYLRFLKSKRLIDNKIIADFKEISNNKDKYEDYYYESIDDDFLY
ncbi:MAG: hypothetical protein E7214_10425 [Clostridium sp.]|nr:hypothetical protein [Clostridium sp.]